MSCAARDHIDAREIGQAPYHRGMRPEWRGHHVGPAGQGGAVEDPGGQQPRRHRHPPLPHRAALACGADVVAAPLGAHPAVLGRLADLAGLNAVARTA